MWEQRGCAWIARLSFRPCMPDTGGETEAQSALAAAIQLTRDRASSQCNQLHGARAGRAACHPQVPALHPSVETESP